MSARGFLELRREAAWPDSAVLSVEVCNSSAFQTNLHLLFVGADREVRVRIGLFPGWPVRLALPLSVAAGDRLFLRRSPGLFKMMVEGANLPVAEILRIEVRSAPDDPEALEILHAAVCAAGAPPPPLPLPPGPLVDGLHQWTGREWAGKASGLDEVRITLRRELADPEPAASGTLSRFGGWKGLRFEATGGFRTHHDGRRWWLVDPEGCAFWSCGVDCIGPGPSFLADGVEPLLAEALPRRGERPDLWTHHPDWGWAFAAGPHNLERVLGDSWRAEWEILTRRRLVAAGFNTVANWSDGGFARRSGLPRVVTLRDYPTTERRIFRDCPDVFDPAFESAAGRFAEQLAGERSDPMVLGYFMGNEPQWAFVVGLDLASQVLRLGAGTETHAAFVRMLQERHGSVDRLNAAWGAAFRGFGDFAAPVDSAAYPGAGTDTAEFTRSIVGRFVGVPARACRAVAPALLNLGIRWAWVHSEYQFAGAAEIDVFSLNCYQARPDDASCTRIAQVTGRPVMIGEFHVGSLDRGLPSGGIRNVRTMGESVAAYGHYLEHAAAHPAIVGAHYFQWADQHVLGRFDGENMQIGLVDITGRMYAEWRTGAAAVHARLHGITSGERVPSTAGPVLVAAGTLCA